MHLTELKSRDQESWVHSRRPRRESISLTFPAASGCLHSWLMTPFLHFKASHIGPGPPYTAVTLLLSSTSLSLLRALVITPGSLRETWVVSLLWSQLISNLNSNCNLNSPLPCKVTYYRFWELGCRHHWGTIILSAIH